MTAAKNFGSPSMTIAPGVVERVIAISAGEVEGVASVSSYTSGPLVHQMYSLAKNQPIVTSINEEGKLEVKIHIACWYGYSIPDVARKVQQNIADALLLQVAIEVGRVDVFVESVQFKKAE
jgi:uncharacterized alkaline shock family protein YloU